MKSLALSLALIIAPQMSLAIAQEAEKGATPDSGAEKGTPPGEETRKPELRPTGEPRKVRVVLPSPYDSK